MSARIFTLFALVLGITLGLVLPSYSQDVAILGTIFITLLKLIIVPLIFISCFLAFANVESTQLLKTLGARTFGYYISTSMIAGITGITCAYIFLNISDVAQTPSILQNALSSTKGFNLSDFILGLIPTNIFQSFVSGNIIHIIIVALGLGLSTHWIKVEQRVSLVNLAEALNALIMVVINAIIQVAPIGIFSLVYASVASLNFNELSTLGGLIGATLCAGLIHSLITLPLILKFFGKVNPFSYIWKIKDALIVAFSTASSNATLPVSTEVLIDNAKIDKKVVGFVLPLGATLNMDGSALYQAISIIFMGKLAGIDFTTAQILLTFTLVMFSSAGTAGIPSGGIVMITMIMNMVGIPIEYIGIYILVDRFMDYPITAINVYGDLVGAQVVGNSFKNS